MMAEMMLGFECPHGFVDHYADCEKVNKPECVKCRDKAKLISQTMNGCFIGKWISVKDRLPDNDAICLVCGKKGGMRVARAYVGKNYTWWTVVGTGKYFKATHWMPLPEPPKEG